MLAMNEAARSGWMLTCTRHVEANSMPSDTVVVGAGTAGLRRLTNSPAKDKRSSCWIAARSAAA